MKNFQTHNLLCQQWSSFGSPPLPPPTADVIYERPIGQMIDGMKTMDRWGLLEEDAITIRIAICTKISQLVSGNSYTHCYAVLLGSSFLDQSPKTKKLKSPHTMYSEFTSPKNQRSTGCEDDILAQSRTLSNLCTILDLCSIRDFYSERNKLL